MIPRPFGTYSAHWRFACNRRRPDPTDERGGVGLRPYSGPKTRFFNFYKTRYFFLTELRANSALRSTRTSSHVKTRGFRRATDSQLETFVLFCFLQPKSSLRFVCVCECGSCRGRPVKRIAATWPCACVLLNP